MTLAIAAKSQQQYHVQGSAEGYDGLKVMLMSDKKQPIDSAIVTAGRFSLSGPLTQVAPVFLSVGKARKIVLLNEMPLSVQYTEIGKEVNGKQFTIPSLQITGDKDQDLLAEMNNALSAEMLSMLAISLSGEDTPAEKKDSMVQMYVQMKALKKAKFDSIVANYHDSYVSGMIINNYLSKDLSYDKTLILYEKLSDRVKNSSIGDSLKVTLAAQKLTVVGNVAPDFTLTSDQGKAVTLSKVKAKCLLIDFWASWCGPCLREVPNIKAVYERHKKDGFEVISVSLDDDKGKWLGAIKKHAMPWTQVSSLKGWRCPVAKLYNVSAIPAMVLLDENGKIVSTNARGEALEKEVSKLCKQ